MSESEQIRSFQKSNDLNVLADIFSRHRENIFNCCMYYLKNARDSEDACVDIFLELREKIPRHEIHNFPGWLHRLTQNHCRKKLRGKSKIILSELLPSHEKVKSESEMDHRDELFDLLPNAIDSLSDVQRWCIVLFYLHGKTYQEIESIKGYSFNQIKSAIQHGKKNLKKMLEDESR